VLGVVGMNVRKDLGERGGLVRVPPVDLPQLERPVDEVGGVVVLEDADVADTNGLA
jgi:hypothetical protein